MSRNIWFTSDWHLGHENIIKLCNRPFKTVEEMDEAIIGNFNDTVKDEDEVYFLGDFCWDSQKGYRMRMRREFDYFLRGNHDTEVFHDGYEFEYLEVFHNPKFILCHYPFEDWNGRYKGSIHLHGHTHGQLLENRWQEIVDNIDKRGIYDAPKDKDLVIPNRFDVSVECTDYKPIHIDEILAKAVKV